MTLEDRTVPSALAYSTLLDGTVSREQGYAVAVDGQGSIYLAGRVGSLDFPATPGAFDTSLGGFNDAFVAKFLPNGSLAWATYLGGSGEDWARDLAVDGTGVYVTGRTESSDFPTTPGAFDTSFNGGVVDAFVTKLSLDGSALSYSTYLGGSGFDVDNDAVFRSSGIAIDGAGSAYVVGSTDSVNFPTTAGSFQPVKSAFFDVYVTKLNASGSALVYSTFLGGGDADYGTGIVVDAKGAAYLTGDVWSNNFPTTAGSFQPTRAGGATDLFVTKLNPSGATLAYSSYLGGTQSEFAGKIDVDAAGSAYVTGSTTSFDFRVTTGAFQVQRAANGADAIVTKVNPNGATLGYSTYLGGGFANDSGHDIAVDARGQAHVVGETGSLSFPTVNGFQPGKSGDFDAFITRMNAAGSALVDSTFLGGRRFDGANGVATFAGGTFVVGETDSDGSLNLFPPFPTTPNAFQRPDGTSRSGSAFLSQFVVAPSVASSRINDGSAQRSRVTSLTVTFDSGVNFAGGNVANSFTLTRNGGGAVGFQAAASIVNGVTVVTLSNFTGAETQFGSLGDGRFTLTALASQISNAAGQLNGGSNYTFGDAQGLFRMFGDINGDRRVDGVDFSAISSTYGLGSMSPNFIAAFDINGDGVIDGFDFSQFSARVFTVLP